MTDSTLSRLENLMAACAIDGLLLTSPQSLACFAGYETQIEWGAAPWLPCPAALLWQRGEAPVLFLAEGEDPPQEPALDLVRFTSYVYREPLPGIQSLIASVLTRLSASIPATIGAELADLPSGLLVRLTEDCPQLRFIDVSSSLAELRAIKTPAELELIRKAVHLCDCGQRAALENAREGMREIELYSLVHAAIEAEAGCRVPVLADLLSGPRTGQVGGPPSSRSFRSQDLVLIDLVVRLGGYWGDSCNTFAIGTPTRKQQELFGRVHAALDEAIDKVQPGLAVAELDGLMRERVTHAGSSYPHHSGHGIGVTWHEEPRVVPYSTAVLREGMVIALEPGIYVEGEYGLRLESVVAVTSHGAEVLTGFSHSLELRQKTGSGFRAIEVSVTEGAGQNENHKS
jgi:Xaa-Pro aminopeptidase